MRASLALCQHLSPFLLEQRVASVGVYLATRQEISLDPLIERLLEAGVTLSAPRLDTQLNAMAFFRLPSLEKVSTGRWDLREPTSKEEAAPPLVLLPGVAFDARGHRLGMGAGYYDRFLTPDVTTVGVAYDWQIVPSVPCEKHDFAMNWVFSEQRKLGPFFGGN